MRIICERVVAICKGHKYYEPVIVGSDYKTYKATKSIWSVKQIEKFKSTPTLIGKKEKYTLPKPHPPTMSWLYGEVRASSTGFTPRSMISMKPNPCFDQNKSNDTVKLNKFGKQVTKVLELDNGLVSIVRSYPQIRANLTIEQEKIVNGIGTFESGIKKVVAPTIASIKTCSSKNEPPKFVKENFIKKNRKVI